MKTFWIAALTMMLPTVAGATGDRIVVLGTAGGPGVRAQLTDALCLSEECIAPERVLSGGKLNWDKVAREHLVAVVQGHAVGAQMQLEVLRADRHTAWSDKVALNEANRLSVKDLVSAAALALTAIDHPGSSPSADHKAKAVAQRPHAKPTKRLALRPPMGHARG